jgi:hypothetical protein
MPDKKTIQKAKKLAKEGKAPSTQAGEFIRAEIDKIRDGEHGARSTAQAIAIGLSEARRAGVKLPPPKKGKYGDEVREKAEHELEWAKEHAGEKPSPKRSRASLDALKKEGKNAASHAALSRHAKTVSNKRTAPERSAIAKKAAETRKKGSNK